MKKNKTKILGTILIILSIISIGVNACAHSGRTDANGGHRDNKNKSGLGSYHYHCGGHPAHLHPNGVCPYSSSSSSSKSSTSSSSSSSKKTATPSTIAATGVQIDGSIGTIEVGDSKFLTATITPTDATDKNITWKSSDETIATVSTSGQVTAKKSGIVDITATTSNGKTSTVKISIKEPIKIENTTIENSLSKDEENTVTEDAKDSNVLGGIVTVGVLGGAGYLGYKQYKKRK